MKKTFEKPAIAKTEFEATAHLCIPGWYPSCPPSQTPPQTTVSGGMTTNGGNGCGSMPPKKPCSYPWWPWW